MGAMEWMVRYIILLNITSNKACRLEWATTIECQNAFAPIQCCALCGGQNISDYEWYKVQTHVLKVCPVHSIHSLWKSKWMATYMQCMPNNNLEIRIVGSSRHAWLSFIQIQTCQYIVANSFWVKLINLLKHEIFVLLWQEFLKTSQVLLHISNNFPETSKLCQKICEVVLTTFEQFWSYFKCQREILNWIFVINDGLKNNSSDLFVRCEKLSLSLSEIKVYK